MFLGIVALTVAGSVLLGWLTVGSFVLVMWTTGDKLEWRSVAGITGILVTIGLALGIVYGLMMTGPLQ